MPEIVAKVSWGRVRKAVTAFYWVLALALVSASPAMASPRSGFEPPTPPQLSAASVYVYDATAKVPLFAKDADAQRAPASLTKIVTALVVVEHAALDETVTIQPEDIVDETQSRAELVEGDTLSVRDLLVGLLVPSGNDAALALARHVGSELAVAENADPVNRFVAEMNRLVADRGLTNTRFSNPSGIDGDQHVASARDLALLTAEAIENPTLAEIMGTASATLPSSVNPDGYLVNTTHDMVLDGSAVAGKTGTTDQAGGCLVTVTLQGENRIVAVILGADLTYADDGSFSSPARYADTRDLIAVLPERYDWVDPSAAEAVPGLPEELSAWGASLNGSGRVPVPRGRAGELGYRLVLGAPAEPGAPVGTVLFLLGSEVLTEQPVVQAGFATTATGDVMALHQLALAA
ncbi:MAG: D-alanyl-D-alanine carboxypeptidase [uncultured Thermomicrobiales bacterium]|uniref:D-alanyl-D-alanine carboxypeptidase n=1 Tax=uncultured Thermomicrobiales bacterium TaxID=1645740 RepID=A0A6J4VKU6_9BACT|nr:MAG: D-alanyl-D-alanine carboxypeptidase [uncultured Thermomicrobiales bacterium]